MIIVNSEKKQIFFKNENNGKLKQIKGDFEKIYNKISLNFKKFNKNGNILVNNIYTSKINQGKDIYIIDPVQNKCLILSKKLIYKFGFDKVIQIIFWFESKKQLLYKGEIFDFDFNINNYKIKKINNKEKLYKLGFKYTFKKEDGYYKVYGQASLGLGNYTKNNGEIYFTGIDKHLKIANKKAISEGIERINGSLNNNVLNGKISDINQKI